MILIWKKSLFILDQLFLSNLIFNARGETATRSRLVGSRSRGRPRGVAQPASSSDHFLAPAFVQALVRELVQALVRELAADAFFRAHRPHPKGGAGDA